MANETTTLEILLSVKNQASDVLKKFGDQVRQLGKEFSGAGDQTKKAEQGIKDLGNALASNKSELQGLVSGFQNLAAAIGGLVLLDKIKGLADVAGRTQVLGTVLNEIGRASGYSRVEIEKFDKAVQAAGITASAARQTLTQFLQAGLDPSKAAELARAAQNFAVVSGENSSEALQRLVTNIQQVDTVGLRFQGVVVDMEQVMANFARTVGKTPAELTRAEKQTALLNEVLKKGAESGNLYVAAMGDVNKAISSLARQEENLAKTLGDSVLPAQKAIVDEYTIFLRQANLIAESAAQNTQAAEAFGETVRSVARFIREATIELLKFSDLLKLVGSLLGAFLALRTAGLVFSFIGAQATGAAASLGVFVASLRTAIGALVVFQGVAKTAWLSVLGPLALLAAGVAFVGVQLVQFAASFQVVRVIAEQVASRVNLVWQKLVGVVTENSKAIADAQDRVLQRSGAGKAAADQEKSARTLNDILGRRIRLEEQLLDAEVELVKANKEGSEEEIAAAQEVFDRKKELRKQLQDDEAKARKALAGQAPEAAKARQVANEQEAAVNKISKGFKKLTEEYNAARKELQIPVGLDKQFNAEVLSEGFTKIRAALKSLVTGFDQDQQKYKNTTDALVKQFVAIGLSPQKALVEAQRLVSEQSNISLNEIRLSIQRLAEAAKTPDEISAAIREIDVASQKAKLGLENLRLNLNFDLQKASLEGVSQSMRGYNDATERAKAATGLLRTLVDDAAKASRDFAEVFSGLGAKSSVSLANLRSDTQVTLGQLTGGFALFKSTVLQTSRETAAAVQAQAQSYGAAYGASIRLLIDSERVKRQVIRETLQGSQSLTVAQREADKQATAERIKLAQDYYSQLKGLRDQTLQQIKAYAQQAKSLEEEIFQNSLNKDKALRDIKRQSLDEEKRASFDVATIKLLKAKEEEALLRKQFDLAKQFNSERIQLAQSIASASGVAPEEAQRAAAILTNDAYEDRAKLLKAQKSDVEAAANVQLKTYQELTTEINGLVTSLTTLANSQVTQIKLEVGAGQTQKILDEIQRTLDQNPLRVTVQAVTSNGPISRRFASGGGVSGPGHDTSDNIPAWLSPGEWITRARAVRHYGADLFRRLNDMTLPRNALRFAAGGMVPAGFGQYPGLRTADGTTAETLAKRDIVDVNLNFNGQRTTLMGERNQVRGLVSALRTLEGSK